MEPGYPVTLCWMALFVSVGQEVFATREAKCALPFDVSPCTCYVIDRLSTLRCQNIRHLPDIVETLKKLRGYKLDRFELAMSDIKYLPSNLFLGVGVDEIYIQDTNVSRFTDAGRSAFFGLERTLTQLLMKRCSLVDQLRWEMVGALDNLNTLDLSNNRLSTVPQQWFDNPPNELKFLYLRKNNISQLQNKALASIFNLVLLDLSENQLVTIKRSMFPYPANDLVYLYLSYNKIESLPGDMFHEMFSLKRLYIDHNRLQVLEEVVWTPIWTQLQILDLLDNDIQCNCSLAWMPRLLRPKKMYGSCRGPAQVDGRKLSTLWPWDIECGSMVRYQ